MYSNDDAKLTIEELKQFEGLGNLTDAEAEVIIETFHQLALIAYNELFNN